MYGNRDNLAALPDEVSAKKLKELLGAVVRQVARYVMQYLGLHVFKFAFYIDADLPS